MIAVVTCEACGFRMKLARRINQPETTHVVCHRCEGVLQVVITSTTLDAAMSNYRRRHPV